MQTINTTSLRRLLSGHALLAGAILIVFWRVLRYPFINDDWGFIYRLHHDGAWPLLADGLSPFGALFFRPIGVLYIAALYRLFGLHAFWYHCVALAIHAVNCMMVWRICRRLCGRESVGLVTAILYGTAVTVHLTPLAWIVGIYDLAAMGFVLVALDLLSSDRPVASSVSLMLALASKESAIFLVPVLVAYQILIARGTTPVRRVARLAPHLIVVGFYAGIKAVGVPLATLPPSYAYHISLRPAVVWSGAKTYIHWFADALAPFDGEVRRLAVFAVLGCVILAWSLLRKRQQWTEPGMRLTAFAAIWAVCGLAPVLALPNHRHQYYLTYSMAPLAFITVLGAEALLFLVTANRLIVAGGLAGWTAIAIWSNASVFAKWEGAEKMLPMAYPVMVASQLPRVLPHLPHGAVLVFQDIDVGAFGQSFGPRVWLGDDTIDVYSADLTRCVDGRLLATSPDPPGTINPAPPSEHILDADKTVWLRAVRGQLVQEDYGAMRRSLCD